MKKLTDGRRTSSDGNISPDPLGQVSLKGQPNKLHYFKIPVPVAVSNSKMSVAVSNFKIYF
jgi:hypothetical protein